MDLERKLNDARRENQALRAELAGLDRRVERIEQSVLFRILRRFGPFLARRGKPEIGYREWLERHRSEDPLQGERREVPAGYVVHREGEVELEPSALAHVCAFLEQNPCDLVYADEGYLDQAGAPVRPGFKPDWSPELLLNYMYLGRFLVFRREVYERVQGRALGEALLDLASHGLRVGHVRRVLSHSREVAGVSAPRTAGGMGKVSVVIPTRNAALLRECVRPLRDVEIIVAHHLRGDSEDEAIGQVVRQVGAIVAPYSGVFNFAAMNNRAARKASGDVLLFLNDDVAATQREWIESMCSLLARDGVGIVGARLLYPNGTIQHAGMVVGMGDGAGHPGRFQTGSPHWQWINHTRNVSAVTGACLAIHRRVFEQLGGFDEAFPRNYNDVDLCLRAGDAGYRVVLDNTAVLTHKEASTRKAGTTIEERVLFREKWGARLDECDPYFTPHLRRDEEDLSLA